MLTYMPEQRTGIPELGERLRLARLASGLSQERVAQLMGRRQRWVSTIERAIQNVLADDLDALATLYGVSADSLLGRESTPTNLLAKLGEVQRSLVAVPIYVLEGPTETGEDKIIEYEYVKAPESNMRGFIGYRLGGDLLPDNVKPGDILILDRARIPKPLELIVFVDNGQTFCGWLENHNGKFAVRKGRSKNFNTVLFRGTAIQVIRRL